MFGLTRWNPIEDIIDFQREADRLFDRFWFDLPSRVVRPAARYPVQIHQGDESWRIDIPMPGIDPANVTLEVIGNTVHLRARQDGGRNDGETQFERTVTLPRSLDLDAITATHRFGMLTLTVPLEESARPRRIQIDVVADSARQLTAA